MKNSCEICSNFNKITNIVGYCSTISVGIGSDVAIINTRNVLEMIGDKLSIETIYANPIVPVYFSCPFFKRNRDA